MINNRQNGRRRGRGGNGRTPNNAPGGNNRQDNRQRGNAAQLLEKYKQLARDTQLQGDRVQTEYYLQFADHYFRVLNENRSRFEEQRPRRDHERDEDDFDDGDEGDDLSADGNDDGADIAEEVEQPRYQQRPRREYREEGEAREAREPREAREAREPRETREAREPREPRAPRGEQAGRDQEERPRRRQRRDFAGAANGANGNVAEDAGDDNRIALDILPPAISAAQPANEGGDAEEAPKPRRRTRRPRADDDGAVTPEAA